MEFSVQPLVGCLPRTAAAPQSDVRERLLKTAAELLVAGGDYVAIGADDLALRAGVGRDDFFMEFESAEECLLLAYEGIGEQLARRIAATFERRGTWPEKVGAALRLLLEILASRASTVDALAIRMPAATPAARLSYRRILDRFIPLVAEGREYAERADLPKRVETLAIGGAEALIFDEIVAGRTEELPGALPQILFAVLVPYLGPHEADRERRAAERAS
jgi:AcrR family transcriptional regulator